MPKTNPILWFAAVSIALISAAHGQNYSTDPQVLMNNLIRQTQEDMARERAKAALEEQRKRREEDYDRAHCIRAGYRGPDIDACVEASGLYRRRRFLPMVKQNNEDPVGHCTTIYNGDGTSDADCY